MLLHPRGPFDWELSCRFACSPPAAADPAACASGPGHWESREYRRVVRLGPTPALLRIKSRGVIDRPVLEWHLEGDPVAAAALVHRIAAAGLDLAACYAAWAADPPLCRLAQRWHGLRLLQSPSLYEALLGLILERQLAFPSASQLSRRFREACGPRIDFGPRAYFGYPRPADLARLRPEQLLPLGMPAGKAAALLAVARAAAAGRLAEPDFARLDIAQAEERLLQLRGVGPWTAACALLRGLGRADALPAADPSLQQQFAAVYELRRPPSPQAIRRRWSKLAPWRGYAALYAWFGLWAQDVP